MGLLLLLLLLFSGGLLLLAAAAVAGWVPSSCGLLLLPLQLSVLARSRCSPQAQALCSIVPACCRGCCRWRCQLLVLLGLVGRLRCRHALLSPCRARCLASSSSAIRPRCCLCTDASSSCSGSSMGSGSRGPAATPLDATPQCPAARCPPAATAANATTATTCSCCCCCWSCSVAAGSLTCCWLHHLVSLLLLQLGATKQRLRLSILAVIAASTSVMANTTSCSSTCRCCCGPAVLPAHWQQHMIIIIALTITFRRVAIPHMLLRLLALRLALAALLPAQGCSIQLLSLPCCCCCCLW